MEVRRWSWCVHFSDRFGGRDSYGTHLTRMADFSRPGGRHWAVWVAGLVSVLAVFVACSYLPEPFGIVVSVVYAVGLGSALSRGA